MRAARAMNASGRPAAPAARSEAGLLEECRIGYPPRDMSLLYYYQPTTCRVPGPTKVPRPPSGSEEPAPPIAATTTPGRTREAARSPFASPSVGCAILAPPPVADGSRQIAHAHPAVGRRTADGGRRPSDGPANLVPAPAFPCCASRTPPDARHPHVAALPGALGGTARRCLERQRNAVDRRVNRRPPTERSPPFPSPEPALRSTFGTAGKPLRARLAGRIEDARRPWSHARRGAGRRPAHQGPKSDASAVGLSFR
jgi:hypothetical protein